MLAVSVKKSRNRYVLRPITGGDNVIAIWADELISNVKPENGDKPRFPVVRWTIIGLFVLAMVLNYLARSVLGVSAPMILSEQSISSEQYSWITSAFQLGVMLQPFVG